MLMAFHTTYISQCISELRKRKWNKWEEVIAVLSDGLAHAQDILNFVTAVTS